MECATSGFPKNRDTAISLAAPGLSYARAGNWAGCVKSAINKWLRIMRATAGAARYWCEKALWQGLRHLATGQVAHRTTSRLERHNRELRRWEKLGTVWMEHNLLALLPEQGLSN